ncbi:MAG: polysaccharide deacetylase family protein [Saprospirales bacterium]|nr:polysaccharide deacetylase family protein [Saprospirales bacterium]
MLHIGIPPGFEAEKVYALSVLLDDLLGIPFEWTVDAEKPHYRLHLPNGTMLILEDHFFEKHTDGNYLALAAVPAAALTLPHPFDANEVIFGIFGRSHFSLENQLTVCGIDLVASAFFMLSRWEEYVRPERDDYGRFPAASALAVRDGFIDRPVVNEYAALLLQLFHRLGWYPQKKPALLRLHLSHDVDHPLLWWSVADRLRTLAGSIFQRKNLREAAWWLSERIPLQQDPYDIFEAWMDFSEKNGLVSHFNFLGERQPGADAYYPLQHPFVKRLLQRIAARGHGIGFHPSLEAFAQAETFRRELESLRRAAPGPVTSGRQHYLCFSPPHTWQLWADAGLAWDSTLGYPEAEGFRCGICQEFPVFNFLTRQVLPLREKPLIAMDVTLANYRRYTPEQAYDRLQALRRNVEIHGGEFALLWHNSSWNTYFWAPWQRVYREFVSSF